MSFILFVLGITAAGSVSAQEREQVGILPDGGFRLNSGWRLTPAGTEIKVDTLPMSAVKTPDGRYLLVLNGGYNPPSVSVIDLSANKEVGRVSLKDAWLGLTITRAGNQVYVGGGSQAAIYELTLTHGSLAFSRRFSIISDHERKTLDSNHATEFSIATQDFVGDVELSTDEKLLYAADLYHNCVIVLDRASGRIVSRIQTGWRPYRIVAPPGGSIYVSNWTDGTVDRYDARNGARLQSISVGPHTTDLAWRPGHVDDHPEIVARLFASASNTNDVFVIGVDRHGALSKLETINLSLTPRQPPGTTPSGMGLSPDGRLLYVACSDLNAVAVIGISAGQSEVQGFVPAGWYPTAAFGLPDGRVGILNGRGMRSYPNPAGPSLLNGFHGPEFTSRMQTGTVELVKIGGEEAMRQMTRQVLANTPYRDKDLDDPGIPPNSPIRPGGPIKHVVYIIKENRSYDQVLGDLPQGNGDPSLVLFGERVTPNQHKLARQFVLLDNFYVNGDGSADGHQWATAAMASDYTQRLFGNSGGARRINSDFDGDEPTTLPAGGYIWREVLRAGISMRNYGWFSWSRKKPLPDGTQIERVNDPSLATVTDMEFRAFDFNYSDVDRAKAFINDLHRFENAGQMPQFMLMWLPNDHTAGTSPGLLTPLSYAADNDQAVGMVVAGLSTSPFWKETAIFIVEDDSCWGPDHVDSHRSPAYIISPWVRHDVVDSTFYNQTSVLRTIEILLGLSPMTVYDAGSKPMFDVFTNKPNVEPYTLLPPKTSLIDKNPANSPTAALSKRMNFSVADDIDDQALNNILWRAIKGNSVPPPAPVSSVFSNGNLFGR